MKYIFFALIFALANTISLNTAAQSGGQCRDYTYDVPLYDSGIYSCLGTVYVGDLNTYDYCDTLSINLPVGEESRVWTQDDECPSGYSCSVAVCGCYVYPPQIGYTTKKFTVCDPISDFSVDQSPNNPTGTNIIYFFSEASDADGSIVLREWWIDGTKYTGENNGSRLRISNRRERTVTVKHKVTDNDGNTASFSKSVTLLGWSCNRSCDPL